jgi:hypothetical protein
LIRQCFPRRSDLFGWTRSKPSQGSVPADLTLASDLAFVFNPSRVRPKCCVDPLRPPRLPGLSSELVVFADARPMVAPSNKMDIYLLRGSRHAIGQIALVRYGI